MKEDSDIDYMHPDGKPIADKKKYDDPMQFDGRELEAASKREKNALIDADGHHICSVECLKGHKKND